MRALILAAIVATSPTHSFAKSDYTSIWSMGDSLTDTGRIYEYLSPWYSRWIRQPVGPNYDKGRFTNGPVWTEYLGGHDRGGGLPGVNYAWGGAITGSTRGIGMSFFPNKITNWIIPSLEKQVANDMLPAINAAPYTSDVCNHCFGTHPLLTVWFGANNFRVPAHGAPSKAAAKGFQDAKQNIVNNVPAALRNLHNAFVARAIRDIGSAPELVTYYAPTTPDLCLTPQFSRLGTTIRDEISQVTRDTNRELKRRLYQLNDSFAASMVPGRIVVIDSAAMMEEIVNNPTAFNLINATDNCVDSGTGKYVGHCNVTNANRYLYWDNLHPTTYVHEQLAAYATNTDKLERGADVMLNVPYVANIEWRPQQFSGNISGQGRMIKRGEAMLTLGGLNSYTGGTRFDEGTLRVFRAESLGSPNGDLVFRGGTLRASGAFALRHNVYLQHPAARTGGDFSGTFDVDKGYNLVLDGPMLYGDGNLAKVGAGTLNIRSHIETSRQTTLVAEGVLLLNSPDIYESRTIIIKHDAGLGGGGRVKGSIHSEGAVLALGNDGGLKIMGDYYQSGQGVMVVASGKIQPALMAVEGTAHVAGAVVARVDGAKKFLQSRQTLLSAGGGVVGHFSGATATSPFVGVSLTQDARSVSAVLDRNFAMPAASTTEASVGKYLTSIYREQPQGDLDRVFTALDEVAPGPAANHALNVLSGEGLGRVDGAVAAHQRATQRSILDVAAASRRRGAGAEATSDVQLRRTGDASFWAHISSLPWRERGGDAGAGRDNIMSAGVDKDWMLAGRIPVTAGVAVSHGQLNASWSMDHRSMNADSVHLTGYAALRAEPWFIDTAVSYGVTTGRHQRMLSFGNLRDTTTAEVRAHDLSASIRTGVTLSVNGLLIEPSLGLDWMWLSRLPLRETGAGAASILAAGRETSSVTPSIGINISRRFSMAAVVIEPAIWARFEQSPSRGGRMRHTLAGAPSTGFILDEPDSWNTRGSVLGARITVAPAGNDDNASRLFVAYEHSSDHDRATHRLTAGMNVAF